MNFTWTVLLANTDENRTLVMRIFFRQKMVLSLCLVWDLCCCNKCRPVLMTLTQNRDSQWMRITHIASRVKNIFNTFFRPTTSQPVNQPTSLAAC